MKYPKFYQKMLDDIDETDKRLKKLNEIGEDALIRKKDPELADALRKAIENTHKKIMPTTSIKDIPVTGMKVGKTLNIPDN